MGRKDHLPTLMEDSINSKREVKRINAILFQAPLPTITQIVTSTGIATKTPVEVKDTKFPVLNPIEEIGQNTSNALDIDLSLENSPFHSLELSDVGATVTDLAIGFIMDIKFKVCK